MKMPYGDINNPIQRERRELRGEKSLPVQDGQDIFTKRSDAFAESCRML